MESTHYHQSVFCWRTGISFSSECCALIYLVYRLLAVIWSQFNFVILDGHLKLAPSEQPMYLYMLTELFFCRPFILTISREAQICTLADLIEKSKTADRSLLCPNNAERDVWGIRKSCCHDPTRKNPTSIYTDADVLSLLPDFSLLFIWLGGSLPSSIGWENLRRWCFHRSFSIENNADRLWFVDDRDLINATCLFLPFSRLGCHIENPLA